MACSMRRPGPERVWNAFHGDEPASSSLLKQGIGERVVLLARSLDPEDVVEQQLVLVGGGEASQLEVGPVQKDAAPRSIGDLRGCVRTLTDGRVEAAFYRPGMTILVCYDGSPDSKAAIDAAASIFPGASVEVLTVWEGFTEVLVRAGGGIAATPLDFERIDGECEQAARERAREGASRARVLGLDAEPRVAQRAGATWETILGQADRGRAAAIVVGTRGLKGIKSLMIGSVSRSLLQHADRPVIVVPALAGSSRRSARRDRQVTVSAT